EAYKNCWACGSDAKFLGLTIAPTLLDLESTSSLSVKPAPRNSFPRARIMRLTHITLVAMSIIFTSSSTTKAAIDDLDIDIHPCGLISCHNGGQCRLSGGHPYCACAEGFSGPRCETCEKVSRNPCVCLVCENGGTCTSPLDRPVCECPGGFTGKYCELRDTRNPCDGYKCKNGGKCQVVDGSPVCECKPEYYGKRCEEDRCGGCRKSEKCVDSGIVCKKPPCPTYQCQAKVKDPCKTFPCQNGGRCTVYGGKTQCICPRGYKGPYCMKKKDPCKNYGCQNGGTCRAVGGRASCSCPSGYTGKRCKRDLCGGCKKKERCVFTGIVCVAPPCPAYECRGEGVSVL
ncbi:hypothetical protein EGW08_019010, partial [Elysia chlorotica]